LSERRRCAGFSSQEVIVEQRQAIKLVKARAQDAETLADISKRAFHTDVDCGSPGKGGPPGYDSPVAHAHFVQQCDYYEILLGETIVGAVMGKRRGPRQYECTGLFVDPDHHNQGIATQAFDLLWEEYPLVKRWTVGTPEWNVRTRHFYEKIGFERVGTDGRGGIIFAKSMEYCRR
jgi:GNAT superfamily N-acetyltransferase